MQIAPKFWIITINPLYHRPDQAIRQTVPGLLTSWAKKHCRESGRRNGTCRSILLSATTSRLGEKFPMRLSFSPDGSDTPVPVSKLVKDLWVQIDNLFSPSVNKARQLIFMIRRSFRDLSKSAFIALNGSLVHPHLEYGMPACSPILEADINHLERIQRLAPRLVTGISD